MKRSTGRKKKSRKTNNALPSGGAFVCTVCRQKGRSCEMEYLVNSREMKYCDTNTTEHFKIPSMVLMERAALGVVQIIMQEAAPFCRVLVVCGCGNNGADGMAIARMLFLAGKEAVVYLAGDKEKLSPLAREQYAILEAYHIPFAAAVEDSYDVVVDAVFGIGLSRQLDESTAALINRLNAIESYKVAVDIPSGVSADNGMIMGAAYKADITVTFAYKKLGMVLYPGASYCGRIHVCDIGMEEHSWLDKKPCVYEMVREDLSALKSRTEDANKGTFGKVLIIAGSLNMAGAAILSAKAAYAAGCGLVQVFTPEENRIILQTAVPEAVLKTYSAKKPELALLNESLAWADVIVLGPGLGRSGGAHEIVKTALKNAAVPMVADADALNLMAEDINCLLKPHTELIITPHPGEMARLNGNAVSYIKENLVQTAEDFARTYQVITVLKDARTVTAVPYGKTYINTAGNNGMATAGSGDVLSGILGSLIAQGLPPELAAPLGVLIHASAGDEQEKVTGKHALTAGGIIEGIGRVLE